MADSAVLGLLAGGISGAGEAVAGMGADVMAERAQARRDMAKRLADEAAAEKKAKADAAKEKKDPKTITTKEIDPETGLEVTRTLERDPESGTYGDIVEEDQLNKYQNVVTQMVKAKVPRAQIQKEFKAKTGSYIPSRYFKRLTFE